VAKNEKGESLYLPEKWIDSEGIDNYPVIRMEILNVSGQVGKDKGDGTGDKWTLSDLYDEMRTKAAERFSVDGVDRIVEDVTVDFEMLGDTAEHPELKKLETVLLYDKVGAINETIGLDVTLTVTELEWDAVREKVVSLKLSSGNEKAGKNVTGYNVQNKSIGVNKLSDDVAQGILEQVVDIIPEYADPNAARPGVPNTVSQDGYVLKGQGQASKVWKTDADGNPGWREAANVVDNLTSTSATDALSAKQGKVLNDTKAGIYKTGSVTANSSVSVTVERGRMYVLVCGGAYATGSMYIVFGWTAGAGRVQTVKANTAVTVTIDANRNVTISSTEGNSYSFVDIGSFA
jgi:hypothetical protein